MNVQLSFNLGLFGSSLLSNGLTRFGKSVDNVKFWVCIVKDGSHGDYETCSVSVWCIYEGWCWSCGMSVGLGFLFSLNSIWMVKMYSDHQTAQKLLSLPWKWSYTVAHWFKQPSYLYLRVQSIISLYCHWVWVVGPQIHVLPSDTCCCVYSNLTFWPFQRPEFTKPKM